MIDEKEALLVIQSRSIARLTGVDAISFTGSYIGLSDQCYSRVGEHVEFATSGINILAVRPCINGYTVSESKGETYIAKSTIVNRLKESIQNGYYVFSRQQGPWSIYKKTV